VLLSSGYALGHEANPSRYNYREHIRPIFVERCGGCHRKGGVAPMSLLEYQEAVPWANAIKMQVLGARMPPWLPEDGVGRFRHARTLTAEEIDRVIDWTVGLTPEGEPLTAEELREDETPPWSMGVPDLVLSPSADIIIKEDDTELTACVILPTGLREPRTIGALELKPGRPSLVRSATLSLGESCRGARPLATWLPGQGSVELAQALPAGASLAVEILYVKGWEDEGLRLTDRSEVGLRFSSSAVPVQSRRVDSERYTFDDPVDLVALFPDPDTGGAGQSPFRIEVVLPGPDREARPILVIEAYDAHWREKYIFETPLRLPAGTELRLSQPAAWIDFLVDPPATAGE